MSSAALWRSPIETQQNAAPEGAGRRLALADLSLTHRVGLKGEGAPAFLASLGLAVPDRPNAALPQAGGGVIARLGTTECLVYSPENTLVRTIESKWNEARAARKAAIGWLVSRRDSHAHLGLEGSAWPERLARACAVDLGPARFGPGAVAQTSLARAGVILVRAGETPALDCFVDRSLAAWLWTELQRLADA